MTFDLIALDLDGTALRPDRTNFSIRLQAALAAAHQKGIAVVPITGRQYGMLPPAVRTGAPWEKLCVLCNGGEVRTLPGGQLLEAHYLARGELLALVELLLALGRVSPIRSVPAAAGYLLACGLFLELAPLLYKPSSVCDPWDLLAYLAGGLLALPLERRLLSHSI